MSNSVENVFIDALMDLVSGITVELYDGSLAPLNSVHFARRPSEVFSDVVVLIIPKGPKFEIARLGLGANIKATDKVVGVEIQVYHDGKDEELVVRNISNITFKLAEVLLANRRLGGCEFMHLVDTDYDWASAEDADNPGSVIAATSAVRLPVVAVYRRDPQ